MRITVYTALFGPDAPRTLAPPRGEARFVCVTDRPRQTGWDEQCRPAGGDPRAMARRVKIGEAWAETDVSIWIDATFRLLVDPTVLVQAAALTEALIVAFAHPDRQRMSEEADEVIRQGMAPRAAVERQQRTYQAAGFDTSDNPQRTLTTTGLLVRWHTPEVTAFNCAWQAELEAHTLRDQLSVDYVAWRLRVPIGYLPGHYRANAFAHYDRGRRIARVAA